MGTSEWKIYEYIKNRICEKKNRTCSASQDGLTGFIFSLII